MDLLKSTTCVISNNEMGELSDKHSKFSHGKKQHALIDTLVPVCEGFGLVFFVYRLRFCVYLSGLI